MTTRQQVIEALALDYHKAVDGSGEGEYGCPGATCPGVQRLAAFGMKCAEAAQMDAHTTATEPAPIDTPEQKNARKLWEKVNALRVELKMRGCHFATWDLFQRLFPEDGEAPVAAPPTTERLDK